LTVTTPARQKITDKQYSLPEFRVSQPVTEVFRAAAPALFSGAGFGLPHIQRHG
jgi:hypothetical protein